MDIWAWVNERIRMLKSEDRRLAQLIYRLPTAVVDNQHEQADNLAAEALALARGRGDVWLEIFIRHWRLQSLVFKRLNVKEGLPEAVSLLERAHREDAQGCPQSVCASQDLCAVYGQADGPGYAEERLKVAHETLSRIDPSWPCWRCITGEAASAYLDQERPQKALDYIDEQFAATLKVDQSASRDEYRGSITRALTDLGRFDEALRFNDQAKGPDQGAHFQVEKRLDRAWILCKLQRLKEAQRALPSWEELKDTPDFYLHYTESLMSLLQGGLLPWDRELSTRLRAMFLRLAHQEACRMALKLGEMVFKSLLERGSWALAEAWMEELEALIPQLHRVQGADLRLLEGRRELERRRSASELSPQPLKIDQLLEAWERCPEEEELAWSLSEHWLAEGFPRRAEHLLRDLQKRVPLEQRGLIALAEILVEGERWDELEALLEPQLKGGALRACALWLNAQALRQQGQGEESFEALKESLSLEENTARREEQARWYQEAGRYEEALEALNQAVAQGAESSALDWARISLGTRLKRWEIVREAAARLKVDLAGEEGPVWQERELCRVAFKEQEAGIYFARRDSPVSAKILEMDVQGRNQYGSRVLIDPKPLAEGEEHNLFQIEAILERSNFRFFSLDGLHPGEESYQALKARMEFSQFVIQKRSGEAYRLQDPESDAELPGIYALIALRPEDSLEELERLLKTFQWERESQLFWPELLEALERPEEAREHRLQLERYGA